MKATEQYFPVSILLFKVILQVQTNALHTLWCLTYCWISCWQEDGKGRRQIDILIAKSDQNTATCATQLTVQHRIQNWIVALNILLK